MLYIPAHNTCMDYEGVAVNYIAGTPYLGASVRMYPGEGGYQGELVAWDVANAKKAWSIKEATLPVYSGVLATGGDLVFTEPWMDGSALPMHTAARFFGRSNSLRHRWRPDHISRSRRQTNVAIYAGVGGWMGATALPDVSTDDPDAALGVVGAMKPIKGMTQPGDLLYVFSF